MIHDDRNDKQFRFGFPGGPILPAEEKEALRVVMEHVKPGDYLVASGSLPNGASPDFYSQLGRLLKDRGVKFVLDTSREALINGLEGGTYMMKPNWREISELTGVQEIKPSDQERLVGQLVEQGKAEIVIASMGSQGAMVVTKDKVDYVKAAKVKMKSTVGAGDSMLGAIVYKLSQGWDLKEAAMYGTAAGSSASAQPGTQLCTLEHTESLFAHIKQKSK
jgi:6-phosphofructokinase 2